MMSLLVSTSRLMAMRSASLPARTAAPAMRSTSQVLLSNNWQLNNHASWFSTTTGNGEAQPAETQEESLNVPKNMVRFLIGFKGRNLASLAERSGGAKILFTKQETPQGEEIAKIMGDAQQIAQMKQLIQEELEKLSNDPTATAAAPAAQKSASSESDYMEEVIVDAQYVGFLIGKQGVILKDMETSTGAKIQYSNRDDDAQERTARIRGSPAQVQAAKKLISDKIFAVAEEMRSGKRAGSGRPPRPQGSQGAARNRAGSQNDVKQVVEVPSECVGALIGKGGKSLFQMQDKTGAKFNFAKEDHREGAREVTIYGSEDEIRAACDLIQQRVRQVLDRNAEQPNGLPSKSE